jgi:hypothetical protein
MINEFHENTQSYCRRIQADCEDIKYLTDLVIFEKDPGSKQHYMDRLAEALKRIKEHLDAMERV